MPSAQPMLRGTGTGRESRPELWKIFGRTLARLIRSPRRGRAISHLNRSIRLFCLRSSRISPPATETIDDVLVTLGQIVRIVPPTSITNYLKSDDRRRIGEVLESQKTACSAIKQRSTDEELQKLAAEVEKTCVFFPQNYYAIPLAVGAAAQADEVSLGANAPQNSLSRERKHKGHAMLFAIGETL